MRKFSRIAATLLLGSYFGALVGCGAKTEASKDSSPSTSATTLALDPWEVVPGLESGNLKSLAWAEDRLFAMGDSGVFQWANDAAGFELLPDAETLSDFGLDTSPSPPSLQDQPEFGLLDQSVAIDQLFAVVGGELFRREGDRWSDTGQAARSLTETAGTLFLRRPGEILASQDGRDWNPLASIPSESADTFCCSSPVAADPVRNRLYLFNDNGVFAYGLSSGEWTALDTGDDFFKGPLTFLHALFVDPSNGDLYVGTLFDLYVSEDGRTWSPPLFKTQTGIWGTTIFALARDPSTGSLYAATSRGVFIRSGQSDWTPLPNVVATINDLSLKDGVLWAATSSGLWSLDVSGDGSGWTQHDTKGLTTKNIEAMELSGGFLYAQSDEVIYDTLPGSDDVATAFHVVYKQVGPGSWVLEQRLTGLPTTSPSFDAELATTVFARITVNSKNLSVASTPQGVLFYLDNGPWTAWNDDLPTFRITSFAYDSFAQTLYAGTIGHGVYRLSLAKLH